MTDIELKEEDIVIVEDDSDFFYRAGKINLCKADKFSEQLKQQILRDQKDAKKYRDLKEVYGSVDDFVTFYTTEEAEEMWKNTTTIDKKELERLKKDSQIVNRLEVDLKELGSHSFIGSYIRGILQKILEAK